MDNRAVRRAMNSMSYWWPLVDATCDVPRPNTILLDIGLWKLIGLLDGEPEPARYIPVLQDAADILGYPCFMRTDLCSAKHSWVETCFVESRETLGQHLFSLVEENECADFMGLPYRAIALREFIPLDEGFKAFGGMPIAPEMRVFTRDGVVACNHFYWPANALAYHVEGIPDWEARLKAMRDSAEGQSDLVCALAEKVGAVSPGWWSIDFARGLDGTWWWIDAAIGELSWAPEDCPMHTRG